MHPRLAKIFRQLKQRYGKKSHGQGLVEYALLLLCICIFLVVSLDVLGPQIGSVFSSVRDQLSINPPDTPDLSYTIPGTAGSLTTVTTSQTVTSAPTTPQPTSSTTTAEPTTPAPTTTTCKGNGNGKGNCNGNGG